MIPGAELRHQGPGRLRLGVPAMRGDAGYFEWVNHQLNDGIACRQVSVNPRTAGILIQGYGDSLARLQALGREREWFELQLGQDGARRAANDEFALPKWSPDRRTLAMTAVLAMAAYQFWRGEIFGPAAGYLLNAAELGHWLDPRP